MIAKIITSYLFFCLLVAIFFSLSGIGGNMQFGEYFQQMMSYVNNKYASMQWTIPNVPEIPTEWLTQKIVDNGDFVVGLLLFRTLGVLIFLTNMLVKVLNVVVFFLNLILHLFEYLYIFVLSLKGTKEQILDDMSSSVPTGIFKGLLKNPIVAFWGGGFQSPLNL